MRNSGNFEGAFLDIHLMERVESPVDRGVGSVDLALGHINPLGLDNGRVDSVVVQGLEGLVLGLVELHHLAREHDPLSSSLALGSFGLDCPNPGKRSVM